MNIDINKVNLSEKDIEDWLYANPALIKTRNYPSGVITSWIGRQYRLPSGIADLVGLSPDGRPVVIEVKNVPINKAAVLQVCRYALDIDQIAIWSDLWTETKVARVLIGPSIDDQTDHEAFACGVEYVQFSLNLNVTLRVRPQDSESGADYYDQIDVLAKRPEWSFLIKEVEVEVEDKWKESEENRRKEFSEFNTYLNAPDEYDKLMDAIADDADALGSDEEENDG